MLYPIELLGPDHAGGILATPGPFVMPHAVRAHTRQTIGTSSREPCIAFCMDLNCAPCKAQSRPA